MRQIASDPHSYILRQGWANLDFREEEHAARLGKLLKSLEMQILSVLEATNQLRESPEFELYELTAKNAEIFDEVLRKQTTLLEKEITGRMKHMPRRVNSLALHGVSFKPANRSKARQSVTPRPAP